MVIALLRIISWQQERMNWQILFFWILFSFVETNYEKFKAEKEEEQIDMQRNYKRRLSDADVKMR